MLLEQIILQPDIIRLGVSGDLVLGEKLYQQLLLRARRGTFQTMFSDKL